MPQVSAIPASGIKKAIQRDGTMRLIGQFADRSRVGFTILLQLKELIGLYCGDASIMKNRRKLLQASLAVMASSKVGGIEARAADLWLPRPACGCLDTCSG